MDVEFSKKLSLQAQTIHSLSGRQFHLCSTTIMIIIWEKWVRNKDKGKHSVFWKFQVFALLSGTRQFAVVTTFSGDLVEKAILWSSRPDKIALRIELSPCFSFESPIYGLFPRGNKTRSCLKRKSFLSLNKTWNKNIYFSTGCNKFRTLTHINMYNV